MRFFLSIFRRELGHLQPAALYHEVPFSLAKPDGVPDAKRGLGFRISG